MSQIQDQTQHTQPPQHPASSKRRPLRFIIPALLLAIACFTLWILKSQGLIQDSWFALLWVRWLLGLGAGLLIIGVLLWTLRIWGLVQGSWFSLVWLAMRW